MPYVYSTASADVSFHQFGNPPNEGAPSPILHTVTIKGGANILTRNLLETPLGIPTEVSNEDLDFLLTDATFKGMVERGFMKADKSQRLVQNISKAVSDMEAKDKSAPTTPSDFSTPGSPKPFVVGEKKVLL